MESPRTVCDASYISANGVDGYTWSLTDAQPYCSSMEHELHSDRENKQGSEGYY